MLVNAFELIFVTGIVCSTEYDRCRSFLHCSSCSWFCTIDYSFEWQLATRYTKVGLDIGISVSPFIGC